jgi:hypothetical protein
VTVISVGDAGCNIVSWIVQKVIGGCKTIAADTDAVHLAASEPRSVKPPQLLFLCHISDQRASTSRLHIRL